MQNYYFKVLKTKKPDQNKSNTLRLSVVHLGNHGQELIAWM